MTPQAPSRSRLPRAERERQMLETAHALFAERGYAAVTMDEVAAAVGVTKPLLYTYFGNKDRLYLACMRPAGDALLETVVAAIEGTDDPARRAARRHPRLLRASSTPTATRGACCSTRRCPRAARSRAACSSTASASRTSCIAALLAQIPRGRGGRRARAEVAALSAALLGAAEALGRWWLRTGAIPADEAAELLVATVEPGLRERAAGRTTENATRESP